MSKVVVISDTHFPFHNRQAFQEMLKVIRKEKPTHIIQIGDLLDQYSYSRYSKESLEDDFDKGLLHADDMWKTFHKWFPKAKKYQVVGNHDIRLLKKAKDRFPEAAGVLKKHWRASYTFPGVVTLESDRDFIEIDGVVYTHGWLSKSIDHAKHFNKPTVHGHRHRPAIEVDRPGLWSMDVGFLGDESKVPFNYTMSKITKWTLSFGIVENGEHPRLIFLKGGK